MPKDEIALENYYSLVELLEKLGKDGVTELVTKGNLQRTTKGDMIYFLKGDVDRILGENILKASEDIGLIVDNERPNPKTDLCSQLVFKQTLLKRHKMGKEEEVYKDKILDMNNEVVYGRSKGDTQDQEALKACGILSSVHGKLYLDEDENLLYENYGTNKSKIRGCKDKDYSVLDQNEVGVLIPREMFEEIIAHPQTLSVSIKIGYQLKPHFIIRIKVSKK